MEKTHGELPKTGSTFVTEQDTLFTSTEPVKFGGPEKAPEDQSEGVKQENPNVTRVVNPPRKSTSNLRFDSSCNCLPSLFFIISDDISMIHSRKTLKYHVTKHQYTSNVRVCLPHSL